MNKDEENKMRQHLIDYIQTNDSFYADENFDAYSTTSLVIIKTQIQLAGRKAAEKDMTPERKQKK